MAARQALASLRTKRCARNILAWGRWRMCIFMLEVHSAICNGMGAQLSTRNGNLFLCRMWRVLTGGCAGGCRRALQTAFQQVQPIHSALKSAMQSFSQNNQRLRIEHDTLLLLSVIVQVISLYLDRCSLGKFGHVVLLIEGKGFRNWGFETTQPLSGKLLLPHTIYAPGGILMLLKLRKEVNIHPPAIVLHQSCLYTQNVVLQCGHRTPAALTSRYLMPRSVQNMKAEGKLGRILRFCLLS